MSVCVGALYVRKPESKHPTVYRGMLIVISVDRSMVHVKFFEHPNYSGSFTHRYFADNFERLK